MNLNLVLDIGANTGEFTATMLALGAKKVITVEPVPFLTQMLEQRFLNDKRVVIVKKAISDHEGEIEFYFSPSHTISTASRAWVEGSRFTGEHEWTETIQAPCTTIDSLVKEYGLPELIKIDVEGYELTALKGLTRFLPCIVSFEWAEESKEEISLSLKHLHTLGYKQFGASEGTDSIDAMPSGYLNYEAFASKFIGDMDPQRKKAWGMVYAVP